MRVVLIKFIIVLSMLVFVFPNIGNSAEYQPWSVPSGHSSSWFEEGDEIHQHINGKTNEGVIVIESQKRPWMPMVSFLQVQTPKQSFIMISINSAYTNQPIKTSKAYIMLDGKAWNHHESLEMTIQTSNIPGWKKINKYAKTNNAYVAHYMIKYISKSDIDEIKKSKNFQIKIDNTEFLIDLKQFDLDRLKWFKL